MNDYKSILKHKKMTYKKSIKRKILLTLVTLVFPVFLFAQYSTPVMNGNNGTSDIVFIDCASLATLNFQSGYPYQYINGKYTWTLYLNGNQINQHVQLLLYKASCTSATAELPYVTFNVSPLSGNYQLRLEIKKYTYVGIGCTGFWVPWANGPDLWSNIINVARPDDGYICKCETPSDVTVSCGSMALVQMFGNPYNLRTSNTITISCNNLPGRTANLTAENAIHILPPFHAFNASFFHAVIDPCDFHRSYIPFDTTSGDNSQNLETENASQDNASITDIEIETKSGEDNNNVIIFPNPNNGIFTLERTSSEVVGIYIYDIMGKIIYEDNQCKNTQLSIDISQQHAGVYFIKIISSENMVVKRIVFN